MIPDSLFTLTNLINIDLNSNMLTGSLSEAVGDLSSLEVLQLENNNLGGVLPTEALLNLLKLGTLCFMPWERDCSSWMTPYLVLPYQSL